MSYRFASIETLYILQHYFHCMHTYFLLLSLSKLAQLTEYIYNNLNIPNNLNILYFTIPVDNMTMNNTNLHDTSHLFEELIFVVMSLCAASFCLLVIIVLIYYVRKRFLLHKDIKFIRLENLGRISYENHLKNLQIKAVLSNFIIIILLLELKNNISSLIVFFPTLFFLVNNKRLIDSYSASEKHLIFLIEISQICYIPVLALLMKVLWLAYLHSPYAYTIMRWSACVVLRLFLLTFLYYTPAFLFESQLTQLLFFVLITFFVIIDLCLYIYYSRCFYLHLKSREQEARLFSDRSSYLSSKSVCLHFKVATSIVLIGLIIFTFSP